MWYIVSIVLKPILTILPSKIACTLNAFPVCFYGKQVHRGARAFLICRMCDKPFSGVLE